MTGRLQLLISTMDDDYDRLVDRMNVRCDAIVINQCGVDAARLYRDQEKCVKWFDSCDRGIGKSRNEAILRSSGEILLFCDNDCVYKDSLEALVLEAFDGHPEADMLLFDFASVPSPSGRQGLRIEREKRVRLLSCMRYGAIRFAIRRESLLRANATFSLLFGGGARYMCGEDTLFLRDCLGAKLKVIALPIEIGVVDFSCSSWFQGFTEQYFRDRGALHRAVMGPMHWLVSLRHAVLTKKSDASVSVRKSFSLMLAGAKNYRAKRWVP